VVGRKPSLLPVGDILDLLREKGASVNLDFIYGLPLQTAESFSETITQAAAWRPNRLVTFSYAHLPKMFPRQQALDRVGLPADDEKNRMYEEAARILKAEGYTALGLDHFVLPDDELGIALAKGELHRNFQGYCTRRTTGQVYAFGVTAISQLDHGYAQNGRDIQTYIERIGSGALYVERGYQLTEQEKLVREVIEALMCNYALDWQRLADDLGVTPDQLREACCYDEAKMREMASDSLITIEGQQLTVHTEGRPFVRNVAAALDPLMRHNDKTFSKPI
jgi:oxygen-independent coproporphyrinogen-3 oxidase